MTIKIDTNNASIKKILPTTDVKWVDKKTASTTDNAIHATADWLTQTSSDTVNASAKSASIIDYSLSTFDNDLTGSAAGKNVITGGTGSDVITGGAAADVLNGGEGSDDLIGGGEVDKLFGGAGDDILAGGAGANILTGGTGFDIFTVEGTDKILDLGIDGDSVSVAASGIANATVSATWVAGFETVNDGVANIATKDFGVDLSNASGLHGYSILGAKSGVAVTLKGSLNADIIVGGAGDDSINGAAGSDSLSGGKGADTFTVNAGTDTVTDLGLGSDILIVGAGATANAIAAKGFTATVGTVNNGTAVITGAGSINLSLATGLHGFTITSNSDKGKGTLTGTVLADTINGNVGPDILVGFGGADTLTGGAGDDTYVIDNVSQVVVEGTDAVVKSGDLVKSSINYTLGANVENLTLTGTATVATGNELANILTANDLGNRLDGLAGADTLTGGLLNDIFVVDNTGDVVIDKKGGTDLVQSSVNYTLGATIENLTLTGSADINGTGNKLVNIINGNSGANTLSAGAGDATINGNGGDDIIIGGKGTSTFNGGAGNDLITAGLAANTLTGGDGADTFVFIKKAGATTITDFVSGTDHLQISAAAVKGLVTGATVPVNDHIVTVQTGTVAKPIYTTLAQFIYDSATGHLSFEAASTKAPASLAAPVLIETLGVDTHPALAGADITIIA